jgi:hypothetical protein
MKTVFLTFKTVFITVILLSFVGMTAAQTVTNAIVTNSPEEVWKIQLKFDKSVSPSKIKDINIFVRCSRMRH